MASTVIGIGLISENKTVLSAVDPTPANYNYEIGKTKWVNTVLDRVWEITNNTVGLATWVLTSNEVSGGDYVTIEVDLAGDEYTDFSTTPVFDSSTAEIIKWYVAMSDRSGGTSGSISFEVTVNNDENSQDFSVSSNSFGSNTEGCNVRVSFPSSGVANLECIVTDNDWKIISKRLDFGSQSGNESIF